MFAPRERQGEKPDEEERWPRATRSRASTSSRRWRGAGEPPGAWPARRWAPRRSASTSSTSRPADEIPAHDHTGDNQEEVFVILEGQGTIVTDGEEHDAPAGTFCRFAPEVNRTIRNESDANVRALLIGVPVDSGYQGMGWG